MKRNRLIKGAGFAVLILLATMSLNVSATTTANPGEHPAYLRALSNLRAARWMLNHRPGNWKQTADEGKAIAEIDLAIMELKKASIDDGKNVDYHPQVEEKPEREGRLRAAVDYLRKAREDSNKEEDNPATKGLKFRALGHIDEAIHATERAIASK